MHPRGTVCSVTGIGAHLELATGHQQGRKVNPAPPGCVRAPRCCQPCFDGAIWQVLVGYPVPRGVPGGSALGCLSWILYPPCSFPTMDQAPARSCDKQGHPLSQLPGRAVSSWLLPALPCSAANIVVWSPSSPGVISTGRNLQVIIPGLFLPCSFRRRWTVVTSVQVVARGNVVSWDPAPHPRRA